MFGFLSSRKVSSREATRETVLEVEFLEERHLLSLTWEVHSEYFGTQDGVSQARSLRGLALSDDGQALYAGMIQGSTSATILKVSSDTLAIPGSDTAMIGNLPNPYGTNPVYDVGVDAFYTTFTQPKGLATDDRGYVYATRNPSSGSDTLEVTIFNANLDAVVGQILSTFSSSQLGGVAVHRDGNDYFAYVGRNSGAGTIERWNVTDPTNTFLDTTWGANGRADLRSVPGWISAGVNGVEVGPDGTVYAAGGIASGTRDSVFRISADGDLSDVQRVDVDGAMDVAYFQGRLYVAQYLQANSAIAVLDADDLSFVETLNTGFAHEASLGTGYSGIDISPDGRIFVVDQIYKFVPASGSFTPPATSFNPDPDPITGTRIYFDRIYVSSQLADPALVYVNDDWAALSDGTQVNVGAGTASIGFDAFASIEDGIQAVADDGTVTIFSGTYNENLDATTKALTINAGLGTEQIFVNGDFLLDDDDVLNIRLNGPTTPGTDYDQFVVSGVTSLGNAALAVTLGYQPSSGHSFTVIDAAAPPVGTFSNNFPTMFDGTRFIADSSTDFVLIAAPVANTVVVGPGPGQQTIRVLDAFTGAERFTITPYPGFMGGINVAMGDVTGNGVDDIITGAGPGGGPHVRVFDGLTGQQVPGPIGSFFAYDPNFRGGVWVAAADLNDDGFADVITGAGPGGGPHVRAFDGTDRSSLASFFAYDPAFRGGVAVAAGDVNGNGSLEIITGAGPGGGPHVRAFTVDPVVSVVSFFAYDPNFRGGVFVAAGDVTGNGRHEIVTGAGPGGGPHVRVFDGTDNSIVSQIFAYNPAFRGGVRVATADVTGDGVAEVITGAGPGGGPHVRLFEGQTFTPLAGYFGFASNYPGGVTVAAGVGASPLLAMGGPAPSVASSTLDVVAFNNVVTQAITGWQIAGLDAAGVALLSSTQVSLGQLPGGLLGLTSPGGIIIDSHAAGYGWALTQDELDQGRMDLFTVLGHEFGHVLGLPDLPGPSDDIMAGWLEPGVRKTDWSSAVERLFAERS